MEETGYQLPVTGYLVSDRARDIGHGAPVDKRTESRAYSFMKSVTHPRAHVKGLRARGCISIGVGTVTATGK